MTINCDTPPKNRQVKVLVLDDEPIILMGLRHTLKNAGFNAIGARTCKKALEAIEESVPDVAILDVNLAIETCEEVAHRLHTLEVPFVLHTGDLERHGELVTRLGAPILAKPAFPDIIVQVVLNLSRGSTGTDQDETDAEEQ